MSQCRVSLPLACPRNIILYSAYSVLWTLESITRIGHTRIGTPGSPRIFGPSTLNKDRIIALQKPDLHACNKTVALRFRGERAVYLAVRNVHSIKIGHLNQEWDTRIWRLQFSTDMHLTYKEGSCMSPLIHILLSAETMWKPLDASTTIVNTPQKWDTILQLVLCEY